MAGSICTDGRRRVASAKPTAFHRYERRVASQAFSPLRRINETGVPPCRRTPARPSKRYARVTDALPAAVSGIARSADRIAGRGTGSRAEHGARGAVAMCVDAAAEQTAGDRADDRPAGAAVAARRTVAGTVVARAVRIAAAVISARRKTAAGETRMLRGRRGRREYCGGQQGAAPDRLCFGIEPSPFPTGGGASVVDGKRYGRSALSGY